MERGWDGERVRELMERSGKRPMEMALALHVTLKTIENWLTGRHRPKPRIQRRLEQMEARVERRRERTGAGAE